MESSKGGLSREQQLANLELVMKNDGEGIGHLSDVTHDARCVSVYDNQPPPQVADAEKRSQ